MGNVRSQMLIVIVLRLFMCARSATVSVSTSKGDIIGQINDGYNTFFGVPYAKVDEDNPFGTSLEYPHFETAFNANDSSIICPQVLRKVGGTLQCLRLNIYVPHTANTKSKLPILVWFYGGGFVIGSGGEYGGQYLVKHDIIVITVNYRLGPYGFLCLDDALASGNQGLKDQITALKWIKENIGAFGGNTDKVTIAGESYGGGGVDLHLYSMYETLFDKAIIQSGSIFTEGFFVRPDYNAAIKIAYYLGHNVTTTKDALKLLAKDNPLDVMGASRNLSLRLTACKEKRFKGVQKFVTSDPFHLYNPQRVRNTLVMIGYNSKEAFGSYANKPQSYYENLGDVFTNYLKDNFILRNYELETISDIFKRFYLGGKEIGPESMLELSDFSSDYKLNNAAERSVDKLIEQGGQVYKYLFSYIGGSLYKNITGVGAIHTEELKYLFEMSSSLNSDEQKMMRDRMTTMWAQFVKFGNPTPQLTNLLPVTWTPVSGTAKNYLNIDLDMSMGNQVYHQRIAFWDLFWNSYMRRAVVYDAKGI